MIFEDSKLNAKHNKPAHLVMVSLPHLQPFE